MDFKSRKSWLYLASGFYIIAGVNHFVSPEFYIPLIPPFFKFPDQINILSGIAEIFGGLGLLSMALRKYAVWGLILLLLAFVPSHIYFIEIGSCINNGLCVPGWVGWIRLIIIHPILIVWLYKVKDL